MPSCIQRGILKCTDIMINGRLLSLDEFIEKFNHYPRCYFDYNLLANATRSIFNNFCLKNQECYIYQGSKVDNLNRKAYSETLKETVTPLCKALWERKYGISVGKEHWNLFHELHETRLRILCWKIAHNIYPTNILLLKMKISPSRSCKFCTTIDFIEHFFYQCPKVKPLWNEITKDLNSYLGISVALDEKIVLLGSPRVHAANNLVHTKVNLAIAIGKLTVSKFRYGKPRNIIEIYETEASLRKLWL